MIVIKKNTWHYKLYRFGCVDTFYGDDINLCHYINHLMVGLLAIIFIPMALLLCVGMMSFGLFKAECFLFTTYTYQTVLSHLGILLFIVGYIVYGRYKKSIATFEKQPNLLFQWIKAKKAKVCPLVKLED